VSLLHFHTVHRTVVGFMRDDKIDGGQRQC
jgi:hypothetical protein